MDHDSQHRGAETRAAIRAGRITGTTAGMAPGCVQGNVAIVPAAVAGAFEAFCRANARACPLLAVGRPGDPSLPGLGEGIDIRTDLPRYRVFRDGEATEAASVAGLWRDDLVTFVIGCSFTFDDALRDAGLAPRHLLRGRNVPMYRTTLPTAAVSPFGGRLVVSMRPYPEADAERAAAVSARFPGMHGGPVHSGDPAALGVADLGRPDFGDAPDLHPGDVPLFWACGVTSQVAIEAARLPFAITHAPGAMLVTDLPIQPSA